jgi:asparagine synthase (glutamine-hydrolysing)
MCRIAGIVNPSFTAEQLQNTVTQLSNVMQHGGPDGNKEWVHPNYHLAFGHRRLALLDLSEAGNQPMLSQDGQLCICFNGEIYNFKQIRQPLHAKGYRFITQTDTEVILYAYQEYGVKAFELLNGMFAFALADLRTGMLYLVRDSAGIKPMYYFLEGNELVFASEVRAFQHYSRKFAENPDWKALFLSFGHLPAPYTTLEGIKTLPKGHYLTYNLQSNVAQKYTIQPFFTNTFTEEITDFHEAVQLVRQTFVQSVERHLIADAPVGIFLSGGIDSSLIALVADNILHTPNNHTVSIVFKEPNYTEKKYQEIVARKLANQHQYFEVTANDLQVHFTDVLQAQDQPSVDGINTYFISKYARQAGLKAVLSGVGADELFGGYITFQRAKHLPFLRAIPKDLFKLSSLLPNDKLKKFAFLALPDFLGTYLFFRGLYTPENVAKILGCTEAEVLQSLSKVFVNEAVKGLSVGNQISWQEFNLYMQNQLLRDSDVMSMWHSIELRTPFLDKEMVALAHRIATNTKFYTTSQTKQLLISAFNDILPDEIWNRPKQGFTFPFQEWFKQHPALLEKGNKATASTQQLIQDFQQGKLHWSRLWAILQVI